jgi:hypothetical protein
MRNHNPFASTALPEDPAVVHELGHFGYCVDSEVTITFYVKRLVLPERHCIWRDKYITVFCHPGRSVEVVDYHYFFTTRTLRCTTLIAIC